MEHMHLSQRKIILKLDTKYVEYVYYLHMNIYPNRSWLILHLKHKTLFSLFDEAALFKRIYLNVHLP